MNIVRHGIRAAAIVVVGLAAASQASADALVAVTRSGNITFTNTGAATAKALDSGGGTNSPRFYNEANQRFIVSYTAECAVNAAAGNTTTWIDLDIVAVNTATLAEFTLPPTVGSADAFCSSNGTAGLAADGWAMNAVNAVGGANMPAGYYIVQVRGRVSAAGTGHLGDSSLVVWR